MSVKVPPTSAATLRLDTAEPPHTAQTPQRHVCPVVSLPCIIRRRQRPHYGMWARLYWRDSVATPGVLIAARRLVVNDDQSGTASPLDDSSHASICPKQRGLHAAWAAQQDSDHRKHSGYTVTLTRERLIAAVRYGDASVGSARGRTLMVAWPPPLMRTRPGLPPLTRWTWRAGTTSTGTVVLSRPRL